MAQHLTRRGLLQTTAAALLLRPALRGQQSSSILNPASLPNFVTFFGESGGKPLTRSGNRWQASGVEVATIQQDGALSVRLHSPANNPVRLRLRWTTTIPQGLRFLGDAWERSYGDLQFNGMEPQRIMPWYVLATDGRVTHAFGVRTAPAALCFWQVDPDGISLWCDLRNGGRAVELGDRELAVAEIVTHRYTDREPFQAARHFCSIMSPHPRLSKQPIYGGNNWYYAYGHSSAADILADSERIASVSEGNQNRPWMVIDDGWSPNDTAGPWRNGNPKFPDMPKLASEMLAAGVRPGIWTRPLFTRDPIPNGAQLRPDTMDPTVPEAKTQIQEDLKTLFSWGFDLVKHDFSTFDLLGRWGFQMNADITNSDWNFHDRTRTNAEVIRDFYSMLRQTAGDKILLGCNTIGHLSTGLFEIQRIGDDTSGRDWNRTRTMGVNTLGFRIAQHNHFFAVDADCVGLTKKIDWKMNRQWLSLLAESGTPVFVSIAPDAFGAEQKAALRDAFRLASRAAEVATPADWLNNSEPRLWSAGGKPFRYDWFGKEGGSPFLG